MGKATPGQVAQDCMRKQAEQAVEQASQQCSSVASASVLSPDSCSDFLSWQGLTEDGRSKMK